VYIGCHDYNLYAINIIDGKVKWTYKTNGLIKSSPLEYRGMVYVGSYDKYLYAIDSATGTLKWSQNTNGNIGSSPVLDDLSGNSFNTSISGYVQ
jgi:outer membrane protein assembly factor BamB